MIPFSDIAQGKVSDAQREAIKRRGCAVIKGHFRANERWLGDNAMLEYLDRNHFDDVCKGPGDTFGSLDAAPGDLPDLLVTGTDAGASER